MALTKRFWDELVELDRPYMDFFRPFALPWWRSRFALGELPYMPPVDMFTRDGDLVVHLELPGIDPAKDVKVTLEEGLLDIKGERKQEHEVKAEGYYRKESLYGEFERRIPVPATVKEADIKADYKDGVLEVVIVGAAKVLPKKAAKEIPIHKKVLPKKELLPTKH